jgi:hypothetical protein
LISGLEFTVVSPHNLGMRVVFLVTLCLGFSCLYGQELWNGYVDGSDISTVVKALPKAEKKALLDGTTGVDLEDVQIPIQSAFPNSASPMLVFSSGKLSGVSLQIHNLDGSNLPSLLGSVFDFLKAKYGAYVAGRDGGRYYWNTSSSIVELYVLDGDPSVYIFFHSLKFGSMKYF